MGLPLWLLRVLSPCFRLSHCTEKRLYTGAVLLPLLLISFALIIAGAVRFHNGRGTPGIVIGSIGLFLFFLVVYTRYWGGFVPRIPDEKDVDRVSIGGLRRAGGGVKGNGSAGGDKSSGATGGEEEEEAASGESDEDDPESPLTSSAKSPSAFPRAPPPPERSDLTATGPWFRDGLGRSVLLRGINMTGCCKLPAGVIPDDGTDRQLENWRDVTFVGRPFPLDEADVHLARLRSWGLTFIRFLYTWEAVEHAGPGEYDEEYLAYLVAMCRKCREYGMSVFLDCHQDTWSRFTGGSGAPAWTLLKAGFDLEKLEESGAAFTDRGMYSRDRGGDGIPRMAWNSNNARVAAGTMWTIFFAGNDFAPSTKIDGESAQDYLQGRFCAMLEKVAEAVRDEPNVVGFDVLNEPSVGFVGVHDMTDISRNQFLIGWRVDVWSAMQLGAGFSQTVDFFESFMVLGPKKTLNPNGVSAWKVGTEQSGADGCLWRKNGVWDLNESGEPVLKDPKYFSRNPKTGKEIDFMEDYGIPFFNKAREAIRKHMPDAIIFIEPIIDMTDPGLSERPHFTEEEAGERGLVWAKHFYDGMTLLSAGFSRFVNANPVSQKPIIGLTLIQRSFGKSLKHFKHEAGLMGPKGAPVLVGETGIPFNMPKNRNFTNLAPCTAALNTTMRAMEIGLVNATIWTYCPINTNKRGDDWNGEDLSLYSADQVDDPDDLHSGGRSLGAAVRPYALRTAGEPLSMSFNPYRRDRQFIFTFRADESISTNESVIFIPKYQYPHGATVKVTKGQGDYSLDWAEQTITYRHQSGGEHQLVVTKVRRN